MRLDEFDYDLPGELIAQHPLSERDASRLMVLDRATQTIEDRAFRELPLQDAIDRVGRVPLPPYIRRPDSAPDRGAYQTVYAKARGAIAAPTAGFHFAERTFEELRARGIETCEITLHVGLATFQPVHAGRVEDHEMEAERFEIPESAASAIHRALEGGRRVIV